MNGEVRFARTLPMSPGSYTAWGAVQDAPTGHAGVASWRVQVEPRGDTGLGISSLVLLSRLERLAPGTAVTGDPLVVGDRMITPNLGEFIHRQPGGKLGFYVTIVGADPGERVSGRLAIVQDGVPEPRPVYLDTPVTLEPADGRGVTRVLGQLPLDGLPLQSLVLRLTVERFGKTDVRTAWFNLRDPRELGMRSPGR